MRVDHLVHKAGLTQGDASEIEVATQNSEVMTSKPIAVIYGESPS
jgi:hypothetical protein